MDSSNYSTEVEYLDPEFMRPVLSSYGLTLVRVTDEVVERAGTWHDHYYEACYIIHPDVYVGYYTDREKLMASVFHEIGHTLIQKTMLDEDHLGKTVEWHIMAETLAWKLGYQEAAKRGFTFEDGTFVWSTRQILSYVRSACVDCEGSKEQLTWQTLRRLVGSLARSMRYALRSKLDLKKYSLTLQVGA